MNIAKRRFRLVSDLHEGKYQRFQIATCRTCSAEGRVLDTTRSGAPPEMMKKKFRALGWDLGQALTADECPACFKARNTPNPAPAKEKPVTAEAPRQPTVEHKRMIRGALFAYYIEEKGCYKKAHSDKSMAASLNVPSAWVGGVREALGFGPDANEAATAFTSEVLAIRADLKELQDTALEFLSDKYAAIEKRVAAVERAGYRDAA